MTYIPIILGTARKGRMSKKVADFLVERSDFKTELIDVRDYPMSATERYPDKMEGVRKKIKKAAGMIIVSPEYNSGYPGELKIFLDSFLKEYKSKKVALVGVSAGSFGGVRMIEKLRPILINLGMSPVSFYLTFKEINSVFNSEGELLDDDYRERVDKFLIDFKDELKT